jgi:hypothetical protein
LVEFVEFEQRCVDAADVDPIDTSRNGRFIADRIDRRSGAAEKRRRGVPSSPRVYDSPATASDKANAAMTAEPIAPKSSFGHVDGIPQPGERLSDIGGVVATSHRSGFAQSIASVAKP